MLARIGRDRQRGGGTDDALTSNGRPRRFGCRFLAKRRNPQAFISRCTRLRSRCSRLGAASPCWRVLSRESPQEFSPQIRDRRHPAQLLLQRRDLTLELRLARQRTVILTHQESTKPGTVPAERPFCDEPPEDKSRCRRALASAVGLLIKSVFDLGEARLDGCMHDTAGSSSSCFVRHYSAKACASRGR